MKHKNRYNLAHWIRMNLATISEAYLHGNQLKILINRSKKHNLRTLST